MLQNSRKKCTTNVFIITHILKYKKSSLINTKYNLSLSYKIKSTRLRFKNMFDNEMYNIKKHIKINCLTEIKTRSVKNL